TLFPYTTLFRSGLSRSLNFYLLRKSGDLDNTFAYKIIGVIIIHQHHQVDGFGICLHLRLNGRFVATSWGHKIILFCEFGDKKGNSPPRVIKLPKSIKKQRVSAAAPSVSLQRGY